MNFQIEILINKLVKKYKKPYDIQKIRSLYGIKIQKRRKKA